MQLFLLPSLYFEFHADRHGVFRYIFQYGIPIPIGINHGLFTAIYLLARAAGKYLGAYFGASITKSPKTVRKFLWLTLLPNSGVSLVFTGIAVIAAKKSFELAGELATYRYFIKRASLSCKGCPFPLMLHGSIFLFPILLSVSANVSKAECFILFYLSLDGGPQIPIIKLESF